jgi:hypothetical protein
MMTDEELKEKHFQTTVAILAARETNTNKLHIADGATMDVRIENAAVYAAKLLGFFYEEDIAASAEKDFYS